METKLIGLSMDPDNSTDALVIVTTVGVIRLSKTDRDADGTSEMVENRIRSQMSLEQRSQFHAHKNRDGTFAYASGTRPVAWPEDEV